MNESAANMSNANGSNAEGAIYDVAIIGGGLVGAVAALCFARFGGAGFRTGLFDRGVLDAPHMGAGRAYALSESSRAILDVLGLWDEMAPHAQPILDIEISDSDLDSPFRPVFLEFSGEIALGKPGSYIIQHEHLARPIYAAVRDVAAQNDGRADGLDVYENAGLSGLECSARYAELSFEDGRAVRAGLCIGADGRGSAVREFADIKVHRSDYNQDGIVVTVELDTPHEGKAVQHFLPSGPFAILPLPGDRASLVWTEKRELAAGFCALSDEDFVLEVNKRFSPKFGTVKLAGPRRHFPLSLLLAHSFIGDRIALIGDAAHGVHPLAGQGMNIGLRDVAALVEVAVETKRLGLDIGGEVALERYQQWRRFDGVMSAFAMDGLNRLFVSEQPLVREVRDFGLRLVDRLPPLKEFFVKEAAGINGDVPLLMQGQPLN